MRFTIPLTLFFAALAIAAPAAEADNDVDAAVSEDPGLADAQRCRPGYRQTATVTTEVNVASGPAGLTTASDLPHTHLIDCRVVSRHSD
ncbi:uncharacterized protein BO88DRAFT_449450 [Aspergillus vadensis CBS 113365]|uniref:Uncharacterized protein n=1 Tax=Aspergillus vadensis (strain CBS 113365 / IMI 142717 / IBT 24658) TaxID=1448311 RepID=A0A319BPB0_ASPVC|nr:hypothetical protein BO88DRAFT_449450 [Aspergillus vadensis CBS 113365]PYH73579.1 hypothetical protein BO88DRAFT_449450 [Aspergillus vadensis CBS 113365]